MSDPNCFIFLLVGLKEACMPKFSFLGSFLQLFHYYSRWPGGEAAGGIKIGLTQPSLDGTWAELGNNFVCFGVTKNQIIWNIQTSVHFHQDYKGFPLVLHSPSLISTIPVPLAYCLKTLSHCLSHLNIYWCLTLIAYMINSILVWW